jgi:chemotaxis signal transduction protein
MSANTNAPSWYQPTVTTAPTIELAIFEIDGISFGLPISKLDRIINDPSGNATTCPTDVEILDLHHQIFGISAESKAACAVVRRDGQPPCAIPIDTVPTLMMVPIDRIRSIPTELRATNPLGIASHVAIITAPTGDLTVFILEI